MNGCCPTNAESSTHGPECYFYWPCGCGKERKKPADAPAAHTHTFGAPDPLEVCAVCNNPRRGHNYRHIFRPGPKGETHPDVPCQKCGAPYGNHPYKHAFKP